MTGKAGGDQAADQDHESGGIGGDVCLVHFENELPNDVELADFRENVDDEVVGGGGEEGRWGRREGFGIEKEGEGNLGRVLKAEENLVEKERGEGDAVELDGGFHGVERVVVGEEELGEGISFLRGLEFGEVEGRRGEETEGGEREEAEGNGGGESACSA